MPAWVKKSITKRTISVTAGTPITIETDPAQYTEIAAADDQRSFVNFDQLPTGMTADFTRYEGARPDAMLALDTTPVLSVSGSFSGVKAIAWTAPAGAARKMSVKLTASSGTLQTTLEMDDVYRTSGG